MAFVDEERPKKNQHLAGLFPKVKDSEIRRFRERCEDNPDRVVDFANGIRRLSRKYEPIEDDYELCVIYLKEQHIEDINDNFGVVAGGIGTFGASFLDKHPIARSFMNGMTSNHQQYQNGLHISTNPTKNNNTESNDNTSGDGNNHNDTAMSRLIPIPRDKVTMHKMKTVLTECQVPKPITNGIIELFSEGFGMKAVMAGIGTIITFFKPTAISTSGMATQLADYS